DHVERYLLEIDPLQGSGLRTSCQLLCRRNAPVQNENLTASFLQPEYRCTSRASGAQHENTRPLQCDALFQWTHHPSRVGVETVKLPILSAHDRIAGP